MNKILTINTSLFGYKFYQKEISNIGLGDKVSLKIFEKENGYKNIFAYNENEKIGELFNDESNQLLPFVSNSDKFKVEAIVKKLLQKEQDMTSAILEIYVYSDENIDAYEYIENFYGYRGTEEEVEENTITEERKRVEQEEIERHQKILKKQDEESNKGCLKIIIFIILIFFLVKMCS